MHPFITLVSQKLIQSDSFFIDASVLTGSRKILVVLLDYSPASLSLQSTLKTLPKNIKSFIISIASSLTSQISRSSSLTFGLMPWGSKAIILATFYIQ